MCFYVLAIISIYIYLHVILVLLSLVFTARCTIVHSAVLPSHVVRPSVCLSVRNVGDSGPHRLEILETNCMDT